jgi:tRNA(fMet)-specific endonuclease VapC
MILLDSDHLSVLLDLRDAKRPTLVARLEAAGDDIGIPLPCVEEQLRGWLAEIRRVRDPHKQTTPYVRLAKLLDFLRDWAIAPWDQRAADQFVQLQALKLRIGTQDQKIAAVAMAAGALLLSANLRDFEQVSGSQVEDWLYG